MNRNVSSFGYAMAADYEICDFQDGLPVMGR